jgi:hypothetical protein
MADTLTTPVVDTAEPGDSERFSHYVVRASIVEATIMGTPVTALCGKTWVPSRDPERYAVCPDCQRIYDERAAAG